MHFARQTFIRSTIVAASLLVPAVASAATGGVYLYLQPLPTDASRLTFSIASMSATGADGSEFLLKLNLTTVGAVQASRQRLLASARLPFGTYPGFVLRVRQAAVTDSRGRAALTVPDAAVRLNVPFIVDTQPTVIWLTLRYQDSITGAVNFSPVFSIESPPKPIADHVGFVTNTGSNTLTMFDRHLAQVIGVIDVCAAPSGMALDQQRRRLYIACSKDDEVRSIDVATGEVAERARLSPGDRPRELALTPDGSTLISVNSGSGSISFYDAVSLVRRERVNVGSGPGSIAVDPTGRRAFVLNTLASSVSVVDIAKRAVIATVAVEAAPLRAQFSTRADKLYVILERSPYMTVLDPLQLTVVTRVRLRIGVTAVAVDTVRDLICVGGDDAVVEFYDPNALMPLYSVRTPDGVSYLAFDAEDNSLYVVSTETRTVAVARLTNRKLAWEIDVGDAPYAVAVMGEK